MVSRLTQITTFFAVIVTPCSAKFDPWNCPSKVWQQTQESLWVSSNTQKLKQIVKAYYFWPISVFHEENLQYFGMEFTGLELWKKL